MGDFGFVFWTKDVLLQALVENRKMATQHPGEFCRSDLRIATNLLLLGNWSSFLHLK